MVGAAASPQLLVLSNRHLSQVLRYKPERWWFEFPMIAYKITVVTASTLMDSEAKAKLLLCVEKPGETEELDDIASKAHSQGKLSAHEIAQQMRDEEEKKLEAVREEKIHKELLKAEAKAKVEASLAAAAKRHG